MFHLCIMFYKLNLNSRFSQYYVYKFNTHFKLVVIPFLNDETGRNYKTE